MGSSVRHQVKNDVNSEWIGPLLGKLVKEVILLALTFPAIPIIGVVRRDDHDAALVIEDRADVHLRAIFPTAIPARVTFPGHAIILAVAALPYVGRLQFVFWNPQIKDAVE